MCGRDISSENLERSERRSRRMAVWERTHVFRGLSRVGCRGTDDLGSIKTVSQAGRKLITDSTCPSDTQTRIMGRMSRQPDRQVLIPAYVFQNIISKMREFAIRTSGLRQPSGDLHRA